MTTSHTLSYTNTEPEIHFCHCTEFNEVPKASSYYINQCVDLLNHNGDQNSDFRNGIPESSIIPLLVSKLLNQKVSVIQGKKAKKDNSSKEFNQPIMNLEIQFLNHN